MRQGWYLKERTKEKPILLRKNYTIFNSENAKLKIELADELNYYDASYKQLRVIGDFDGLYNDETAIKNGNGA